MVYISRFIFEYPVFGRKYSNIKMYSKIRQTLLPTLSQPFLGFEIQSGTIELASDICIEGILMIVLETVPSTKCPGLDIYLTNFLNTFTKFKTRLQFAVLLDIFKI